MVMLAAITGFEVKRILVDSGSAVEVLTWEVYQKLGLKEQVLKKASLLYNFANQGCITLLVTLGDSERTITEYV
ncbi:hypothetical protein J1N35_021931 [Gossypium stocksii]|uniref:Uncharacterized protein n=1 Tax=Gossypium stocksii TaxID=47602 RepID=A0A9D3VFH1_9ROSI|nr:hypothetical protein J1N35_021931 [Gossypium stocksii]